MAYTAAKAGDALVRSGQSDEYMVLIHEPSASFTISANDSVVEAKGRSLVVVPPGESSVTLGGDGAVVRVFTTQSEDLCANCANDAFYVTPDPNVAPYKAWPDPRDGRRIRIYALDEVAPSPERFGRLYRCSTLMVNMAIASRRR